MSDYTHLPRGQQRFLFWFLGLAPVATNIVTPLVTALQLRNKPISPVERRSILVQETIRQGLSAVIGLSTYFGGAWLMRRLPARWGGGKNAQSLRQIVGGTLASFVGYAFIRPLISTDLIVRILNREEGQAATLPGGKVGGRASVTTPSEGYAGQRSPVVHAVPMLPEAGTIIPRSLTHHGGGTNPVAPYDAATFSRRFQGGFGIFRY